MERHYQSLTVRPLIGWGQRLRGLLGSGREVSPVAIMNCRSIHTCWMRYPLDVAFVSSDGVVLDSRRAVPPWRLLSCHKAAYVLERPANDDAWPREGSALRMDIVVQSEGERSV